MISVSSSLHEVLLPSRRAERAFDQLLERTDRLTTQRLLATASPEETVRILATARFSPGLPLDLHAPGSPSRSADIRVAADVPFVAAATDLMLRHVQALPLGHELRLMLDLRGEPRFLAEVQRIENAVPRAGEAATPAPFRAPAPVGQSGAAVHDWFETISDAEIPERDGTLDTAQRAARAYALRAKASNTRRAYRSGVKAWCDWAARHNRPCLPARSADIAAFLADERGRGLAPATLELRRAALTYLHRLAGCPVPTAEAVVGETMGGIQRTAAEDGFRPRRKAAATDDVLAQILAPIDRTSLAGARDALLLLLGFWGAFRRSELAALQIHDVTVEQRGLSVTLPVSKGDRRRKGVVVAVPHGSPGFCAVEAYGRWLALSGVREGPVFRRVRALSGKDASTEPAPERLLGQEALTDRSIARIIQARADRASLDGSSFGGHSLKRGVLTTGKRNKASLPALKSLARHASYNSIDAYLEVGDSFEEHPLAG